MEFSIYTDLLSQGGMNVLPEVIVTKVAHRSKAFFRRMPARSASLHRVCIVQVRLIGMCGVGEAKIANFRFRVPNSAASRSVRSEENIVGL